MLRPLSVLVALLLSLGCASALAEPGTFVAQTVAQARQRRPMQKGGGILQQLNLTNAQVNRIDAIRNQYKKQIDQRQRSARQARQELRSLMTGNASRSELENKFRQAQALRQEIAELHFRSMLEMREVLTPEQRQRFANVMDDRREDFRQRWTDRP